MKKNPLNMRKFPHGIKKILQKMKFTLLFVLLFCFYAEASSQKVSLKVKDMNLYSVLLKLKNQTGVRILYDADYTKQIKCHDAVFQEEEIKDVLDKLLTNTDLISKEINGVFVISKSPEDVKKEKSNKVSGTVKDKQGVPLPGVTIIIKGSTVGVTTDSQGKFVLNVKTQEKITLVFSFIGMITQEVVATPNKAMEIIMEEDLLTLEEVVVETGYQSVNRRDMVGAFTQIKADDINIPAYTTIDQMLQGQVAGMIVQNSSSRVGSSPTIQIRGLATYGSSSPLWVVDGVIQPDPIKLNTTELWAKDLKEVLGNQVSWLNPHDIETITVLKDASATAIYGSRASNGVIVITTKKNKIGEERIEINYNGSLSIGTAPHYGLFNLMNSQERIEFTTYAYEHGNTFESVPYPDRNVYEGLLYLYGQSDISEKEFNDQRQRLETINTDWFDILCRAPLSHSHNIGISGSGKKISYRASIGYNDQQGQEIGNDSKRLSSSMNLTTRLHENLNLNFGLNASSTKTSTFMNVKPFTYATTTSRAIPAFEPDGSLAYYQCANNFANTRDDITTLNYNIINERNNSGAKSKNTTLGANLSLTWQITPELTYRFAACISLIEGNQNSWAGEKTYYIANSYRGYNFGEALSGEELFEKAAMPFGGIFLTNSASSSGYNINNQISYSKTFNENHRLNIMIGTEVRSSTNSGVLSRAYGYIPERGEIIVQPNTPSSINGSSFSSGFGILDEIYTRQGWRKTQETNNYFSLYSTIAYSYKNFIVLNMNVRNDASNRFGQDINKRIDPTYSWGLKWNVSNWKIVQEYLSWISSLSLSVTYGIQGNAQTNISPDLILKSNIGMIPPFNRYGATIEQLPNNNLTWERTTNWNFALNTQLFDKVGFDINYYRRRSNSILSFPVPLENGVSVAKRNGGIIYNKGMEVSLNYAPLSTKDWGLSLSLNWSRNWNEAEKTSLQDEVITYMRYLSPNKTYAIKDGYPVGAFWSFSFKGLNPENGAPMFNIIDEVTEKQVEEDPSCILTYSGQEDPFFTGGLNMTLRYKRFSLSSGFTILLGGKTRLASPYENFISGKVPDGTINLNKDLTKRWKQPGDEKKTNIPGLATSDNYYMKIPGISSSLYTIDMWERSDALVVNRSFLRCRNLSISYHLNDKLCQKLRINRLSTSLSVTNLFTIASKRWAGFDPELKDSRYPQEWSLSVNLGF